MYQHERNVGTVCRDGYGSVLLSVPSFSFLFLTVILLRWPNPGAGYMKMSLTHSMAFSCCRVTSLPPTTCGSCANNRFPSRRPHPLMQSSTKSSIRNLARMLLFASWSRHAQEQEPTVLNNNSGRQRQQIDGEPLVALEIETIQRKISRSAAKKTVVVVSQTPTSLASPRAWLESLPAGAYTVLRCDLNLTHDDDADNSSDDLSSSRLPKGCHIWGLDFHLQRLQQSYEGGGFVRSSKKKEDTGHHLETATASTIRILNKLLQQAVLELPHFVLGDKNEGPLEKMNDDSCITSVVAMATILWHPPITQEMESSSLTSPISSSSSNMIQVQGHILYTGTPTATITSAGQVNYNPDPITAVLATTILENNKDSYSHQRLPNRKYNQPGYKLSNWCQKRRPLEELFMKRQIALVLKGNGDKNVTPTIVDTGEVLLLDRIDNIDNIDEEQCVQLELLEGLTSNLFVVLNGGKVLRTPPAAYAPLSRSTINNNGNQNDSNSTAVAAAGYVLPGFARQRILDCARNLGMRVQVAPILLSIPSCQIEDNGQLIAAYEPPPWEEVFCTSSVKLVTPVERIIVPSCISNNNNNNTARGNAGVGSTSLHFQQLWCSRTLKVDQTNETTTTMPVWKLLYNELLRQELPHHEDQE